MAHYIHKMADGLRLNTIGLLKDCNFMARIGALSRNTSELELVVKFEATLKNTILELIKSTKRDRKIRKICHKLHR